MSCPPSLAPYRYRCPETEQNCQVNFFVGQIIVGRRPQIQNLRASDGPSLIAPNMRDHFF
jgi:hypothetical protein